MNVKIYINVNGNWELLDINETTAIPITKNIFDVRDVTKKKSDFTKTIEFPNTENNSRLFAQAYNINVDKLFDVKTGADVVVYRGNNEVMRGKMYLLAINDKVKDYTYECVIIGNVGDVFNKLQAYQLPDVIDSSVNFVFAFNTIAHQSSPPSLPNISPNYPVFLALFDAGFPLFDGKYTDARNIIPIVFVNYLLERCAEKVGYQIHPSSVIYDTSTIKHKIFSFLSIVAKKDWQLLDITAQQASAMRVHNSSNISTYGNFNFYDYSITHQLLADTEVIDGQNRWNNLTNEISFTEYFLLSIELKGKLQYKTLFPYVLENDYWQDVTFDVHFNDGTIVSFTKKAKFIYAGKVSTPAGYLRTWYADIDFLLQHEFVNKVFKNIFINISGKALGFMNNTTYEEVYFEQSSTTFINAYATRYSPFSTTIPIKNIIPDVNAAEFFKGFLKHFNLFYRIVDENKILIQDYDTFYDSNNVIDISPYVDIKNKEQLLISDFVDRYLNYEYRNNGSFVFNQHKKETSIEYASVYYDTSYLSKSSEQKETSIFSLAPSLEMERWILGSLCDIDENDGKKKDIDYGLVLCLWNGLITTTTMDDDLHIFFNIDEFSTDVLNDIANGNITPIGLSDHPLATQHYTDTMEALWSNKFEFARSPMFDLAYDVPIKIYYSTNVVTNRNVFYSFFYKFFRQVTDKNSLILKCDVAVPLHLPMELHRIYYFDNNYWIISKIADWDISKQRLASIEFIKLIDIPEFEFSNITIGIENSGGIPATGTERIINADTITTEELQVDDNINAKTITAREIAVWDEVVKGVINLRSIRLEIEYTAIPFTYTIPNNVSAVAVAYRISDTFNTAITIDLNGNNTTVQNAGDNGLIANVKKTTNNILTITGTKLTSGKIIVNIITI